MVNLTLFGIALGGLAVALIKFLQDKIGFDDDIANLSRATAAAGLYIVIKNAEAIQTAWPLFETVITQGGGAVAIFLGTLGYWDDVQRIGYRVTGRPLPLRLQ